MDRVGVCYFSGSHEARYIQIAFFACRRADTHCFVGEFHMEGVSVCFGKHCDGFDSDFPAGPDDAECNFTPVRYEDFFKQATPEIL